MTCCQVEDWAKGELAKMYNVDDADDLDIAFDIYVLVHEKDDLSRRSLLQTQLADCPARTNHFIDDFLQKLSEIDLCDP